MTPTQLRMAIAAARVQLRDLAEEVGVDASQISRIQSGKAGATFETMRKLELAFTRRGLRFEQRNGDVAVWAHEPPPGQEDEHE